MAASRKREENYNVLFGCKESDGREIGAGEKRVSEGLSGDVEPL